MSGPTVKAYLAQVIADLDAGRAPRRPAFKTWVRTLAVPAAIGVSALGFAACGQVEVGGGELCNNLIDDDGDGYVDCLDPDCADDPDCVIAIMPEPEDHCSNDIDDDDDGYVDGLFIIHAGQGYEWTGNVDHIHSHAWVMHDPQSVDGVTAWRYSTEPEYWSLPGDMTCGVYAHEMGHAVFGLPDLYDYGYDSNGVGKWSLMASGSWNGIKGGSPAYPDAWCRIQTGAVTPTVLSGNLPGAVIPAINTTPAIFRLWTDGAAGTQFFLVENRRKVDYDSYIPSEGLLIYHIDETQSGNNNQWYPGHTDFGNYLVALEQADGRWWLEKQINSGDYTDPFPGGYDVRTFGDQTTPDTRDYDFNSTKVIVTNISDSDSIMTADLFVTDVAPPGAVNDLAATLSHGPTKSTSGDVSLSWTEPYAEAGVSHYVIYRSTDPESQGDSLSVTTSSGYTDANIVGDTFLNYYYSVRTVDHMGTASPSSNQAGEFDIDLMTAE